MTYARATRLMIVTTLCAGLAACGGSGGNVQTAGGPIDSPDIVRANPLDSLDWEDYFRAMADDQDTP